MFFFIAGIQPKTVEVDSGRIMCPSCGLYQARLKRVDHYLSIFFLPVLRVKKGTPFLECDRCEGLSAESGEERPESRREAEHQCPSCGRPMQTTFRFCPFCGKPVQ